MSKGSELLTTTGSWKAVLDDMAAKAASAVEELRQTVAGDIRDACAGKLVAEAMDALWLRGADELERLFPGSNREVRSYYLKGIGLVLKDSVFHRRASGKPRGYAGDFLTMDMIYTGQPLPTRGASPLSVALDCWFLDAPSAKACRNRHDWLVEELACHWRRGVRRVASLACGPCREVKNLLERQAGGREGVVFDLLDFDEVALEYARSLLEPELKNGVQCRFHRADLFRTALSRKAIGGAGAFDLVYCSGFADYLDDRVLVRLLSGIRKSLAPGGTLLLAQFLDVGRHPDRNAMRWGMDWELIYRTEEQIKEAFSQAGWDGGVEVRREALGLIGLCVATTKGPTPC